MTDDFSIDRVSIEGLEALENELQGVHLEPNYGCPRIEYGSIFRALIRARQAAQPERGGEVVVAVGTVTARCCRVANDGGSTIVDLSLDRRGLLKPFDGQRVEVVVRRVSK